MGTNYYFMTKNKKLVRKYFNSSYDEYRLVDEPDFGYEIHLNKLSCGWRPLFQKHAAFDCWNDLEKFYMEHRDDLEIYDEYDEKFSWEEYKEKIFDHAAREPEPLKWVYDYDPIDSLFGSNGSRRTLHTINCKPEEADLWVPIDHVRYFETERETARRFNVYERIYQTELHYWNDKDGYLIDWTEGEFS